MAGLKQIKTKIRSVEKTQTVTKAMEAVSAAKMRKAQVLALNGRAYARAAVSILARVSSSPAVKNNPLTRGAGQPVTTHAHALYIVITSDKGLAGGLNSSVLRKVESDMLATGLSKENISVITVGKKAQDYFASRGIKVESYHPNTEEVTHDLLNKIVSEAADRFSFGSVDIVKIAYQQFVSTFEQRAIVRTIFPLTVSELSSVVDEIIPSKGAYSDTKIEKVDVSLYTIEPSEEAVLKALIPRLASIFVSHALIESRSSEHSARMVAMKSASDKAEEMEHSLTLQFNKARQAAITREVSEITGGMEAMLA